MSLFSQRLNEVMTKKKLKQKDLVSLTGISKSMISDYVNGRFEPKQENLLLLSDALQVDHNWLMGIDAETILNIFGPYELSSLVSQILNKSRIEKNISLEKISEITRIDLTTITKIFEDEYKFIDFNHFLLVNYFDLGENPIISRYVFYSELTYSTLNSMLAWSLYYLLQQNYKHFSEIEKILDEDYDISKIPEDLNKFPIFEILNNPLSCDQSTLDLFINYIGINIYSFHLINALMYYYFIPDELYMGYATTAFDGLNLDELINDLDLDNLTYCDYLIDFLIEVQKEQDEFEKFTNELYELSTLKIFEHYPLKNFYDDIIEFATYLVNNKYPGK